MPHAPQRMADISPSRYNNLVAERGLILASAIDRIGEPDLDREPTQKLLSADGF